MQHQLCLQRNSISKSLKTLAIVQILPPVITEPLSQERSDTRVGVESAECLLFQCNRKRQTCPSLVSLIFGFAGHTPALQFRKFLSISRIKASLACAVFQPCQLREERTDGADFSVGCCEQDGVKLMCLKIQMKYPN